MSILTFDAGTFVCITKRILLFTDIFYTNSFPTDLYGVISQNDETLTY